MRFAYSQWANDMSTELEAGPIKNGFKQLRVLIYTLSNTKIIVLE